MIKKNKKDIKSKVREYYENIWEPPIKVKGRLENPFLGFHYGLYEKGIKNWMDAAINMNEYIARLFDFESLKKGNILDVGCGIGSTSNYLGLKKPNIKFIGITIAPSEIIYANKIKKDKLIENTEFYLGNFNNTDFSNEFFDGVFALESFCYSQDKKKFVKEMKRVLKSGKKMIIIDGFLTEKSLNSFMKNVYASFLSRREVPNLISIKNFRKYLENENFKNIKVIDLSKKNNFRYNFFQFDYLMILIRFCFSQFERLIKGKSYEKKKDINYIFGALVPELFLGINKNIGYYAVISVKN
jgi:ubiquinone/menaquinone biosynthesis C-methylase UbiE